MKTNDLHSYGVHAANKNYSMRAFARDLEIRPSILSYYLRDERNPSPKSIRALGKRLGLSEKDLKPCFSGVLANKLLQLQVLDYAISALKKQTYAEMDQTSIMFPVKKENLGKIKDRITVFRKQLAAEFNETEDPDEIYQFSFSCFPLTKNE